MSAVEKATVLASVAASPLAKRRVLRDLGVPKSTYYRWLMRQQHQQGLEDRPGASAPPWNRLRPQEERSILEAAREMPELSSRQLAAWSTDNLAFAVSESTVYRILCREGLVKSPEMQLSAGKEYHRKTSGPHQMWATDASYFKVIGWGYYYLVTVMDDYSRFILAHKLQRDMTTDSLIEVVQEAVDKTGMTEVPVADRTSLLSDNGSGLCVPWLQRLPCTWWESSTFWPRRSTLRPMASSSAITRVSSGTSNRSPTRCLLPWKQQSPPSWPTTTTDAITRRWAT